MLIYYNIEFVCYFSKRVLKRFFDLADLPLFIALSNVIPKFLGLFKILSFDIYKEISLKPSPNREDHSLLKTIKLNGFFGIHLQKLVLLYS